MEAFGNGSTFLEYNISLFPAPPRATFRHNYPHPPQNHVSFLCIPTYVSKTWAVSFCRKRAFQVLR